MTTSRKKKILILAGLLAAIGGTAWFLRGGRGKKSRPETRLVTVAQGPIEDAVEATGSVSPLNRVEVKAPIGGRVEELLVEEGSPVRRGQVLAWMSSADRAAILDAARAQGAAELKKWEDAYKPTPIVAPLAGVVILKNVVVGQTVDPSTILFAVSDRLIVLAQVDESDIGRVKVGMPARVTLDAYPDRTDRGKVSDVLYEGKNVSNVIQYGVKVELDQVPPVYRSQMTASVNFIVSRKEDALLLPAAAVRDGRVMVPGPDGKPVPREVTTGLETDEKVEVLSGLQAGDAVLVTRSRYVPQQGPQSSPLTVGGRGGGGRGGGRRGGS